MSEILEGQSIDVSFNAIKDVEVLMANTGITSEPLRGKLWCLFGLMVWRCSMNEGEPTLL